MGMGAPALIQKRDGGVVTVILNRPERMNALHKDLLEQLKKVVDVLETDRTVRVLVITGAGDKAFSAGADLKERAGMTEKEILQRLEFVRALYVRLERLPFPVIAKMNGLALGGGLELALACDLRIVADGATLALPEVELAIIPGNGGTQRLARIVGRGRALELLLLAKRLTAQEALAIGLVHKVVPASRLEEETKVWTDKLVESGPIALRQVKAAVRAGMERPLDEALLWEIECYRPCLSSKDRLEGLKAFSEKRKPDYVGE
jgi:enoyl-CoA hydratase/carnithine racemase